MAAKLRIHIQDRGSCAAGDLAEYRRLRSAEWPDQTAFSEAAPTGRLTHLTVTSAFINSGSCCFGDVEVNALVDPIVPSNSYSQVLRAAADAQ